MSLFYVVFYIILGAYTWSIMAIFMGITNTNRQTPYYIGNRSALASSTLTPGFSSILFIRLFIYTVCVSTFDFFENQTEKYKFGSCEHVRMGRYFGRNSFLRRKSTDGRGRIQFWVQLAKKLGYLE